MSSIDIPEMSRPQIEVPDYSGTLTRLKKNYQGKTGHYPQASDPETFLLEQLAYEREGLVDDINREGQQNLLAFASDDMLDNLGLMVDCERLDAMPALTTLQLTLSDHPDMVVDAGFTMLAADGQTTFATTTAIAISAGVNTALVGATCTTDGVIGNGFVAGEINTIVTPVTYVTAAVNTEVSQGGSEVESNDRYRYRIWLAPSKFSVAGPYDAYEYWTLTANGEITAASVWSPLPNDISVCPLMAGGAAPTQAVTDAIDAVLSDEKVRPLGDRVTVEDPEQVAAAGEFTLEIYRDYQAMANTIKSQFEAALNARIAAWAEQLGRDIVPEALTGLGQAISGVYRCSTTLTFKALAENQNPMITVSAVNVTITSESSLGG